MGNYGIIIKIINKDTFWSFNIDPIELYYFLKSKNIEDFYHANTVTTSCTLIKQKGLLSRGTFERKGLEMTPQSSDDCD